MPTSVEMSMSSHTIASFASSAARRLAIMAAGIPSVACSDHALIIEPGAGQGAATATLEAGSAGSSGDGAGAKPPSSDAGAGGSAETGGAPATAGASGTGATGTSLPASGENWIQPPPPFNRVSQDDAALARRALELMGSSAVGA